MYRLSEYQKSVRMPRRTLVSEERNDLNTRIGASATQHVLLMLLTMTEHEIGAHALFRPDCVYISGRTSNGPPCSKLTFFPVGDGESNRKKMGALEWDMIIEYQVRKTENGRKLNRLVVESNLSSRRDWSCFYKNLKSVIIHQKLSLTGSIDDYSATIRERSGRQSG